MVGANPHYAIAAQVLSLGGVVAYPTEAVWGLGADPFNDAAVEHILQIKRRHPSKGLILVASSMQQLAFLLNDLSETQRNKLKMSWPGPNTWLVPHQQRVSPLIHGQFDSVAVRVSAHPVVKALCERFSGPIVSTSANPQGLSPARFAYQVHQYFGADMYCVPGQVDLRAQPSVIRDVMTDRIIRP